VDAGPNDTAVAAVLPQHTQVAPLTLPPHPPAPGAPGFPWFASIAPIAGAGVLWTFTGSAMSLAFAALGPVAAIASLVDGRRNARRGARRAAVERRAALDELRAAVAARHDLERAAAWQQASSSRRITEDARPFEWRHGLPALVLVGSGDAQSSLRIDGTAVDDGDRELLALAARLDRAPVHVPVDRGVGIVGPPPLAHALTRALVVQLAHRCRPDSVEIAIPAGDAWEWASGLPHRGGSSSVRIVDLIAGRRDAAGLAEDGAVIIALAPTLDELPPGLGTVLLVHGPGRAIVERRGDAAPRRSIVPELLGISESTAWVARMRAVAERDGFGSGAALPPRIELHRLKGGADGSRSRRTLRVPVGLMADGAVELDLVAHGPHAIVAGTTGSGKSEFLLAWIAAMARDHPPDRVAFLLVDFKGGAAFEPVGDLPHVAGVVTDLDEAEAERAVLSLRAELRLRESVLHAERARDIAELEPAVELPRLVIVVDEFQAMVERFPELGTVIADIAARGRSLGVHLILASQRPNGVVREQVTANCAIRVSLRVMDTADSIAVVGSAAAASIGPETPGRGILDPGDGRRIPFQSALADRDTLEFIRAASASAPRARRPWIGPLPARLDPDALAAAMQAAPVPVGSLALGLVDAPELQRHEVLAWSPPHDGHLLVVGAPGSGRSTALAAVVGAGRRAGVPVTVIGGPGSLRWDTLAETVQRMRRGIERSAELVVIDDLDVCFNDWPEDHRLAAHAMVEAMLREGRGRGVGVVASAGSAHRIGSSARELFGQTLMLRHASRIDLVQAGGAGAMWRADAPAGSGLWHGRRVQVVEAPPVEAAPATDLRPLRVPRSGVCAVITSLPRADVQTLRALGFHAVLLEPFGDAAVRAAMAAGSESGAPRLVVGDADAWTGNWAVAAQIREAADLIVRGGVREFRVFGRDAAPPPLLDPGIDACWHVGPGAEGPVRSAWPPVRND
jgi:S-DNA-T family DNA segregation ATPase FtsK/SpoIIIE